MIKQRANRGTNMYILNVKMSSSDRISCLQPQVCAPHQSPRFLYVYGLGTSPLRIGFPPPVLGIWVEDEAQFRSEDHVDQVPEKYEDEGSEPVNPKGSAVLWAEGQKRHDQKEDAQEAKDGLCH